jgi:3-oxoacyl-[acyl-carrier-protein] synthase-3
VSSRQNSLRSVVLGVGSYLPEQIVTNADLQSRMDTSDEWIVQRTGIRQRHIAEKSETTSTLATRAAEAALADAGRSASDIDLIIVATSTPDYTFPAVATQVQAALGIRAGAAFDLQAVCSGFVFALATADKFPDLRRQQARACDRRGNLLAPDGLEDRTTCVLFGDGAGAVVLEAQQSNGELASAASSPRICAPMAATAKNCTSTAAHRPRVLSAICACMAAKFSATPSAWSPMWSKDAFAATGTTSR